MIKETERTIRLRERNLRIQREWKRRTRPRNAPRTQIAAELAQEYEVGTVQNLYRILRTK